MIDVPMLRFRIDELRARAGRDQVTIRRLATIAALVHEEDIRVRFEARHRLARVHIVADEFPTVSSPCDAADPGQPVDDQDIFRGVVAGGRRFGLPQHTPVLERKPTHRSVPASEEHYPVVEHEGCAVGGCKRLGFQVFSSKHLV